MPEVMARGVPLGVVGEMPRTPAVFEEKTAWNVAPPEEGQVARTVTNYSSAQARPDVILKQFEEDAAEDVMVTSRRPRRCTGTVNTEVGRGEHVQDHPRHARSDGEQPHTPSGSASLPDIQAVMHQLAAKQVPHFMLLFDVRKAHRHVPFREEDWWYQARLVDGDFDEHGEQQVWLNKVGTFGMSSAAYWWGRAAAGATRAAHHMLGSRLAVWALLFADDGNLFAEMEHAPRSLVGFLLVMEILGVPLSWKKVRGGIESDFVGVLVGCTELPHGLARGVDPEVGYRAGYGMLGYGADPQRGFGTAGFRFRTSPVVATLARALLRMDVGMSSGSFLPLPAMLKLILEWIAEYIISRRWVCCRSLHPQALGDIFRVDAAEGGLGGLVLGRGSEHARGQMVFAAARSCLDPLGLREGGL